MVLERRGEGKVEQEAIAFVQGLPVIRDGQERSEAGHKWRWDVQFIFDDICFCFM